MQQKSTVMQQYKNMFFTAETLWKAKVSNRDWKSLKQLFYEPATSIRTQNNKKTRKRNCESTFATWVMLRASVGDQDLLVRGTDPDPSLIS